MSSNNHLIPLPNTKNLAENNSSNSHEREERIKAEIIAKLSRNNPNIGRYQTVTLKDGPKAFKIAVLYQILNASSGEHHHIALSLQTWFYTKSTNSIEEKVLNNINLDNISRDEIGILRDSITAFLEEVTIEPDIYAVVKKQHYEELGKVSLKPTQDEVVEDLLESEESYNKIIEKGGLSLFKNIIDWVLNTDRPNEIINKLQELNIETLKDLNILSGLTQIKQVLKIWDNNKENDNEEFWQNILSEYSWVISQLFSHPLVIFSNKAYIGGKNISNKRGNIVDFLYQNKITENVILIEIKTPQTKLLGAKYRQTYAVSNEISGALNQLLNYKKQLQHSYSLLIQEAGENERFLAINPKTLLILGNAEAELTDKSQLEAFELYRSNSKDIEIITFDEIFLKVSLLVDLLETSIQKGL